MVLDAIDELATDTPTWVIVYTDVIAACLNSDNEELWGNAAATLCELSGTQKKNEGVCAEALGSVGTPATGTACRGGLVRHVYRERSFSDRF